MKAPNDWRQLSLFSDPRREWTLSFEALYVHGEKITYLHELSRKIRAWRPVDMR